MVKKVASNFQREMLLIKPKRGISVVVALGDAAETVTPKAAGLLTIPLWSVIKTQFITISP